MKQNIWIILEKDISFLQEKIFNIFFQDESKIGLGKRAGKKLQSNCFQPAIKSCSSVLSFLLFLSFTKLGSKHTSADIALES